MEILGTVLGKSEKPWFDMAVIEPSIPACVLEY
jgi:hypothetical protein